MFSKLNLLIPFGSRCCRYHLDDGKKQLKDTEIAKLKPCKTKTELNGIQVEKILKGFREREQKTSSIFLQFEDLNYAPPEKLFKSITG